MMPRKLGYGWLCLLHHSRDEVACAEHGLGLCYRGGAFVDVGEMGKRGAGNVVGSSECKSTVHSGFDNPV